MKRIVVVGEEGVGKTTFLLQAVNGEFTKDHIPTIQDIYKSEAYPQYEFVDTAGSSAFDRLRPFSYNSGLGSILCFSTTDINSMNQIKEKWAPEVLYYLESKPMWIVGFKTDLREHSGISKEQVIDFNEGFELQKAIDALGYFECNNKNRGDVIRVLETILAEIQQIETIREKANLSAIKETFSSDEDCFGNQEDNKENINAEIITGSKNSERLALIGKHPPETPPIAIFPDRGASIRRPVSEMNFSFHNPQSNNLEGNIPINETAKMTNVGDADSNNYKRWGDRWTIFGFVKKRHEEKYQHKPLIRSHTVKNKFSSNQATNSILDSQITLSNAPEIPKKKKGFLGKLFK